MSNQDDDVQNFAVTAALGVALLSIALTVGVAMRATNSMRQIVATNAVADGPVQIRFAHGQYSLPPEADDVLNRVADEARADVTTMLEISAFFDPTGDAPSNRQLAQSRAERVRHALEANGVPVSRVQVNSPIAVTPNGHAADPDRVELSTR